MYFQLFIWFSLQLPFIHELKLIDEEKCNTQNIIVLGDSHLVGDFGEYFHRDLHNLKKYNVVSIAVGGAGSYHFTVTMRSFCCGYKIRETCWFDSIPDKTNVPVIEHGYGADNAIVGKFFKGKLTSVIKHYNPEIVIVALGSNYTNAHEELIDIIKSDEVNREIIWVGPMLRSNIQMRLYAISRAIKKYPDIRFISSEDLIGHDTITSVHYAGRTAKYWADKVVERIKPHLSLD